MAIQSRTISLPILGIPKGLRHGEENALGEKTTQVPAVENPYLPDSNSTGGIDEGMREYALGEGRPAAIFFEFKAAFPSISQDFLIGTLKHLGIPTHTSSSSSKACATGTLVCCP